MQVLLVIAVVIALLASVASLVMMLTMKRPGADSNLAELEVPSTEIGTPIYVLHGRRVIKAPLLVEYGDVEIVMAEIDSGGKK